MDATHPSACILLLCGTAETTSMYNNQSGGPQLLFLLKMILPVFQDNEPHGSPSITPGNSNKAQKNQQPKQTTHTSTDTRALP